MGRGCLPALMMIGAAGFGLWAAFLYLIDLPAYHAHPFRWATIAPYLLIAALLATGALRLMRPRR